MYMLACPPFVYKSHLYPLVELPTYVCMLIVCVWYAYKTVIFAYEMYQWYVNGKLVSHTRLARKNLKYRLVSIEEKKNKNTPIFYSS